MAGFYLTGDTELHDTEFITELIESVIQKINFTRNLRVYWMFFTISSQSVLLSKWQTDSGTVALCTHGLYLLNFFLSLLYGTIHLVHTKIFRKTVRVRNLGLRDVSFSEIFVNECSLQYVLPFSFIWLVRFNWQVDCRDSLHLRSFVSKVK